jgi:hypothetical protein
MSKNTRVKEDNKRKTNVRTRSVFVYKLIVLILEMQNQKISAVTKTLLKVKPAQVCAPDTMSSVSLLFL